MCKKRPPATYEVVTDTTLEIFDGGFKFIIPLSGALIINA